MKGEVDLSNDGKLGCFDKNSMVPIIIMSSEMLIIALVLFNGLTNKFKLSFKFQIISLVLYFSTLGILIYYSLANDL